MIRELAGFLFLAFAMHAPISFKRSLRRAIALGCSALALWALPALAQTSQPTPILKLRIVGGLAAGRQYTHREEPFWSQDLARLSHGKYTAEIVPFDRAGVPGVEMLRFLQMGVVPFGTVLMANLTAQHPQFTAADLAGLNPDMASLRKSLIAFRPYLEKSLRDKHSIEPLAIYVYPAQVVFCQKSLTRLADLAGRKIRVSSVSQADFIRALGAEPVHAGFSQIVPSLKAGQVECAITGTMSGNTIGLDHLTSYLYAMPLTWGLAVFAANRAAWEGLPQPLRALLRQELPKLEAAIWEESERDTSLGLACNSGQPSCPNPERGHMTVVPFSNRDERLRQEIFVKTVLPRWLQRCGPHCTDIWNQTVGQARGIVAPAIALGEAGTP